MAFHIGLNMAGAVSAGAYTAGVLDFLVEALDEWYAAKAQQLPGIPTHDVILDVISGASAGGMCSAISSVALQEKFDHIDAPNPTAGLPRNRLYHSWVESIDIMPLLGVADLPNGQGPVKSLLDSTPIETIAHSTLAPIPANAVRRAWIAPQMGVILTLSNLRGVPYSVDEANGGAFEERMAYHADRIVFTVAASGAVDTPTTYALNYSDAANPNWQTLATAAMATGAFPVMLAARVIERRRADYENRQWNINNQVPDNGQCQEQQKVQPAWDDKIVPATFENAYVDGGMTNNNPFECARQYLVTAAGNDGHNPREAELANAAVISVAPFPGDENFDPSLKAESQTTIDQVIGGLIGVLVNQARFQGEELILTKDPDVYSRFAISPSDDSAGAKPALLCAALDAFGGFVDQKFRDHDYQLGRRNCQKFLSTHFVLPEDNPIIQAGITKQRAFGFLGKDGKYWYPIIPLLPGVAREVPTPKRTDFYTTQARLVQVANAAEDRVKAVAQAIINSPDSHHPFLSFIMKIVFTFGGGGKIRSEVLAALQSALKDQTEKDQTGGV